MGNLMLHQLNVDHWSYFPFLGLNNMRLTVLEIDQPALIPHIAEASSLKYPYEVLFRSLHKLLLSVYFCDDFFGEESIVYELITVCPFSFIDEHFNPALPNCFDTIGLILMIRIIHHHQVQTDNAVHVILRE
ncbi:unnamed protein product [Brassica oleracea]|uniref:(rape) hypothetical protein n=1 Tax=Brassica napus TaxID=3708 RepID=A0A816QNK8_BRANA|nr:unnamed protein product [Brassica napus]CAF2064248.1 unnamed protein product [Brassica napus]